eukprot:TRINITY_DN137_c9_g1_i1.p1 TRINITY_DN137_c9_g1~~TRINITY_DN137_c9_g1_i1.p1  ORF type:complete len:430 (+),score=104.26 TRINITY_DN137_c9_g1_i1:45-1292(+)
MASDMNTLASFDDGITRCSRSQGLSNGLSVEEGGGLARTSVSAPMPQHLEGDAEPTERTISSCPVAHDLNDDDIRNTDNASESTLLYIDRIPADASTKMVENLISKEIGHLNSWTLEVVRKHKTKHCHAFAEVNRIWKPDTEGEKFQNAKLETGEEVRISVSDAPKRTRTEAEEIPKSTLHIRFYAQKAKWIESANRITWAGVLTIIKNATSTWQSIQMLADDIKKKRGNGVWTHPSVLLGAFFADCGKVPDAANLQNKINDKRITVQGVPFLIEAQFTSDNKNLHEKGKQASAEKKFKLARSIAMSDNPPPEQLVVKKKDKDKGEPETPLDSSEIGSPITFADATSSVQSVLGEPLDEVLGKCPQFRSLFFEDFSESARKRYRSQWQNKTPSDGLTNLITRLIPGGFFVPESCD